MFAAGGCAGCFEVHRFATPRTGVPRPAPSGGRGRKYVLLGPSRGGLSGISGRIAFSSDGALLASRVARTFALHELPTGEPKQIPVNTAGEYAFSPDGRTLAVSSSTGMDVVLWDISGQPPRHLQRATRIQSIAFSPDGRAVATLSSAAVDMKPLRLWELASGVELAAFSRNPTVQSPVQMSQLASASKPPHSLRFSPDGQILAAVFDKEIEVWRLPADERHATLKGHTSEVAWIAFAPDSQTMVSASQDGMVKFWSTSTLSETSVLTPEAPATSVDFRYDGRMFATSHGDGTVRLWDFATRKFQRTIRLGPPRGIVRQVLFTPEGRHLAAANADGTVYILRLESRNEPSDRT